MRERTTSEPPIAVQNRSTVVTDDEVIRALGALQHQVDDHFKPHWNLSCRFEFVPGGTSIPENSWELTIYDNPLRHLEAFGIHEMYGPAPLLLVYAELDKEDDRAW